MRQQNSARSKRRRTLALVHLWLGLIAGLYIVAISLSGSVLVYRTELRAMFDPQPRIVELAGAKMSEQELVATGEARFPGCQVFLYSSPDDPTHAASLGVECDGDFRQMAIDPYTGEVLGNAVPWGWRATSWLLDFHGNLVAGELGKRINGIGSIVLFLLAATGIAVGWPLVRRLKNALRSDWRIAGRSRLLTLHLVVGFSTLAFVVLWATTGVYLTFPEPFAAAVDVLEPLDPESLEPRTGDEVLYWTALIHFGRFGGDATKLLWAVTGLAPVLLGLTGASMWWRRRSWRARGANRARPG